MTPERTWYGTSADAFAFITRAPLTLGHSQLRVPLPEGVREAGRWKVALPHLEATIEKLDGALRRLDLADPRWTALADYTVTRGEYKRISVLRTSADEASNDALRVHLVPLFQSHLDAANARFREKHGLVEGSGGLIGWMATREDIVDYDIEVRRQERAELTAPLDALASILRESS